MSRDERRVHCVELLANLFVMQRSATSRFFLRASYQDRQSRTQVSSFKNSLLVNVRTGMKYRCTRGILFLAIVIIDALIGARCVIRTG